MAIGQKAATAMTAEPRTVVSPKPATFDRDGALADSEPLNDRALGLVLSTYGRRLLPDELRTHFRGTAHNRLPDRAMAHGGLSLPDDIADAPAPRPAAEARPATGTPPAPPRPTIETW